MRHLTGNIFVALFAVSAMCACAGIDFPLTPDASDDAGTPDKGDVTEPGNEDAGDAAPKGDPKGYVVTTYAGSTTGKSGVADSDDPLQATFSGPWGIAFGPDGSLYVADTYNDEIRKIAVNGKVSTYAGTGATPQTYVDGNCDQATFHHPSGLAVDAKDNVYVADSNNSVIRMITATPCKVTTLAGRGTSGDVSGTGTDAAFGEPDRLALNASGTFLYVTDYVNNKIQQVTLPGGVVTTLAGQGENNAGYANGSLSNATFTNPRGVALDTNTGTLYVSESHDIRKIENGTVSLLAGSNVGAYGFVDAAGANARFDTPASLAVDADGNLYVADSYNHAVRKVSPDGMVTTFAGTRDDISGVGESGAEDGPANQATFDSPSSVAVDANGVVYVSDVNNNNIRKITPVY
ncbi:MAG: hypothetical protein FWD69_13990 [Polyangiaceae bacterium]|nr:hypothetical protein [Polyangiaceae bacterium]